MHKYMDDINKKTADDDCSHPNARAHRPFLITVFNFDDSPSTQHRDQLPFLVNRFRLRVNKNGNIGIAKACFTVCLEEGFLPKRVSRFGEK